MLFAFATMIHHYSKHGYWYDYPDIASHEFVAGIFLALAVAFLIGGLV